MRAIVRTCTLLSILASAPMGAQTAAGPLRIGLLAGFNSATVGGSDVDDADRRTGFIGGVYLVKPFGATIAFRPELLYSQKGAEQSFEEEGVSGKGKFKLAYLEVPLLLQLESATSGGLRPHAYAGPSIGVQVSCNIEASGGGVSLNSSCDDADVDTKSLEFAGVVGAGLGFPVSGASLTVGARFQYGFTDISNDGKAQNRVLSFYGSLEFGRK